MEIDCAGADIDSDCTGNDAGSDVVYVKKKKAGRGAQPSLVLIPEYQSFTKFIDDDGTGAVDLISQKLL